MPSPGDSDDREGEYEAELRALQLEREGIICGLAIQSSAELEKCKEILACKLQAAADTREYQRANLERHFELEKKYAWEEYCQGKARLREQIVVMHMERKKRIDTLKAGGKVLEVSRKAFAILANLCQVEQEHQLTLPD
jgi:hypothetical protein